MLKHLYEHQTPLTPQDALSTHKNITRMIRTYHYDHWWAETRIDE